MPEVTTLLIRAHDPERVLHSIEVWSDIKPELVTDKLIHIPGVLNINSLYASRGKCIIVIFDPRFDPADVAEAVKEKMHEVAKLPPSTEESAAEHAKD